MSKSERADDLFILETLRHCKDYMRPQGTWPTSDLELDVKRAIKILEDRKDAQ